MELAMESSVLVLGDREIESSVLALGAKAVGEEVEPVVPISHPSLL